MRKIYRFSLGTMYKFFLMVLIFPSFLKAGIAKITEGPHNNLIGKVVKVIRRHPDCFLKKTENEIEEIVKEWKITEYKETFEAKILSTQERCWLHNSWVKHLTTQEEMIENQELLLVDVNEMIKKRPENEAPFGCVDGMLTIAPMLAHAPESTIEEFLNKHNEN